MRETPVRLRFPRTVVGVETGKRSPRTYEVWAVGEFSLPVPSEDEAPIALRIVSRDIHLTVPGAVVAKDGSTTALWRRHPDGGIAGLGVTRRYWDGLVEASMVHANFAIKKDIRVTDLEEALPSMRSIDFDDEAAVAGKLAKRLRDVILMPEGLLQKGGEPIIAINRDAAVLPRLQLVKDDPVKGNPDAFRLDRLDEACEGAAEAGASHESIASFRENVSIEILDGSVLRFDRDRSRLVHLMRRLAEDFRNDLDKQTPPVIIGYGHLKQAIQDAVAGAEPQALADLLRLAFDGFRQVVGSDRERRVALALAPYGGLDGIQTSGDLDALAEMRL